MVFAIGFGRCLCLYLAVGCRTGFLIDGGERLMRFCGVLVCLYFSYSGLHGTYCSMETFFQAASEFLGLLLSSWDSLSTLSFNFREFLLKYFVSISSAR